MTQAYTGMRKGISLVEMVIAIILFATLATITIKYSKNYLDTDLQAKRARAAALTEQANTLITAHQLFKVDFGRDATNILELNQTGSILSAIPAIITEIGSTRWGINTATAITNHPTAFEFNITADAASTTDEKYCALINHEFNSSRDLNVTEGQTFGNATLATAYTSLGSQAGFCYGTASAYTVEILAY